MYLETSSHVELTTLRDKVPFTTIFGGMLRDLAYHRTVVRAAIQQLEDQHETHNPTATE